MQKQQRKNSQQISSINVPRNFLCVITGQIMQNPVINVVGQSYEKYAIEEWFTRGKRTDPKTGVKLQSTTLIPNIDLRNSITEYLETVSEQRQQIEKLKHQLKQFKKFKCTQCSKPCGSNGMCQSCKAQKIKGKCVQCNHTEFIDPELGLCEYCIKIQKKNEDYIIKNARIKGCQQCRQKIDLKKIKEHAHKGFITIRLLDGRSLTMEIQDWTTLADLRKYLHQKLQIDEHYIEVIFEKKTLFTVQTDLNTPLKSLGIKKQSKVWVVYKNCEIYHCIKHVHQVHKDFIIIRLLDGRSLTMEIQDWTTLADLRKYLHLKSGMEENRIEVVFENKSLFTVKTDPNTSLKSLGIKKQSKVHIIWR